MTSSWLLGSILKEIDGHIMTRIQLIFALRDSEWLDFGHVRSLAAEESHAETSFLELLQYRRGESRHMFAVSSGKHK